MYASCAVIQKSDFNKRLRGVSVVGDSRVGGGQRSMARTLTSANASSRARGRARADLEKRRKNGAADQISSS